MRAKYCQRMRDLLAIYLCFFVSGATGLLYETVWVRQTTYIFGNTVVAVTVVLSTFMAGLALGSWGAARFSERISRPLKAYALLEIGIAISSMLVGPVLGMAAGSGTLFAVLAVALVLLVPTALMGASLPVLSAHVSERSFGLLYGVNSLGAVVGALAAGFMLIEDLGLSGTALLAQGLNFAVGVVALMLVPRAAGEPAAAGAEPEAPAHQRICLLVVFLTGACAMIYEMALLRAIPLVLGSSTYSFALVLGAFIAAISVGSALMSAFVGRLTRPFAALAVQQIAIAALFLALMPVLDRIPRVYLALRGNGLSFARFQVVSFGLAFLVCFLPTIVLGGVLPLAVELLGGSRKVMRAVGRLYAVNTVGNILGTVVAGLVLLPAVGFAGTLETAAAVNVMAGLAVLWHAAEISPLARRAASGGTVLAAVAFLLVHPRPDTLAMAAGVFRPQQISPGAGTPWLRLLAGRTVEWTGEDETAYVTVERYAPDGVLSLRVNGKVDASTGGDTLTQRMLAHVPLLLHAKPRNALVIGLGSGITAASALTHELEYLDCIEISRAVARGCERFAAYNGDVLKNPRLRLHIDDGRHFLERTPQRYDVIISEPSNPWFAGVASLYTREFFATQLAHLTEQGVMAQWLQAYEVDPETFRMVMRTFKAVFPHVNVFRVGRVDMIIIGTRGPMSLNLDELEKRMAGPAVGKDMKGVGVAQAFTFCGFHLLSPADVEMVAGEGALNTDDRPLLEYLAPIGLFTGSKVVLEDWEPRQRTRDLLVHAYLSRRQPKVDELLEFASTMTGEYPATAIRAVLRRAVQLAPEMAAPHVALAGELSRAGERRAAIAELEEATRLEPRSAKLMLMLHDQAFVVESAEESFLGPAAFTVSLRAARAVVELAPEDPLCRAKLGAVHLARGAWGEAEAAFRQAFELGTRLPPRPEVRLGNYVLAMAMCRLEQGDQDGARLLMKEIDANPSQAPDQPAVERRLRARLGEPSAR